MRSTIAILAATLLPGIIVGCSSSGTSNDHTVPPNSVSTPVPPPDPREGWVSVFPDDTNDATRPGRYIQMRCSNDGDLVFTQGTDTLVVLPGDKRCVRPQQ